MLYIPYFYNNLIIKLLKKELAMKRFFACLLMLCMINFTFLPALAEEKENYNTNNIINAQFKTDFNANKASKGQVVQFISTEDYKIENVIIPKGTIFNGEVKHYKKGRWGYRRAKAVIGINKMILPSGETYKIKASTKKHVLKGSALGNTGKGIVTLPVALVVGTVGAVVIVVETISVAGLILVGPTSYGIGRAMGGLTHGINYKKYHGDEIQLKIKTVKK